MGVTLPFRTLEPFGVEITCDLSVPLGPSEAYHLRLLFNQHGLLIARGQALTMEQQRALCGHLGPILDRAGEDGVMSNEAGGPSASALSWHSDAAYTAHPFDALSLHALDVVDGASSTCFIDAAAALASLPDDLEQALAGREQEMIAPHYTRISARTCDDPDPQAQKRGVMPTIMTNPHNARRCLWVGEMQTVAISGMAADESRALLHRVYDHVYRPEAQYVHVWNAGDLVIWDNIALQHARGNTGQAGKRVLQRVIVGTEGVAPHVPA